MNYINDLPYFGTDDCRLFSIEDSRERADLLRSRLVPKLKAVTKVAIARVKEVYGCDPYEWSTETLSPEHRKNALKTKDMFAASAGLVGKQMAGKYISVKLHFVLSDDGLRTLFWVNKPKEANVYLNLLKSHENEVIALLAATRQFQVWSQRSEDTIIDFPPLNRMARTSVPSLDYWWHLGLSGSLFPYPIDVSAVMDDLANDFVTLFPLYEAVRELLHHQSEKFTSCCERLVAWRVGQFGEVRNDIEGETARAYRVHRKREKRLREAKIQEALARGDGRLRCEVPNCGFDFFDTYGELGEGYAQVHHLKPLSERPGPSRTLLEEMAVVCANCHVMIHRGQISRPLDVLIRRDATTSE